MVEQNWEQELFEKYDLLLPSKEDGGLLILTLYTRIQNRELTEPFTTEHIKLILEQIADKHHVRTHHSERIIKNLLHFFLRQEPDRHGLFTLTEHAKRLVELMLNKLKNPYKNFPLKESFEKYFFFRLADIKDVIELEHRFGREFSIGHKRIIQDHLESLADELAASNKELNVILNTDTGNATSIVNKFVAVFKKFGERAEDISSSIASKDNFLRRLRQKVDEFYQVTKAQKHPETEAELKALQELQNNWRKAAEIYTDLEGFFKQVDFKIGQIRKHILKASEKLAELQENFSTRAVLRMQLKKLYHLSLEAAAQQKMPTTQPINFLRKAIPYEKVQLFFPEYYNFQLAQNNQLVRIQRDETYERQQKEAIERDIKQQELINRWIANSLQQLHQEDRLQITDVIRLIVSEHKDVFVAQSVALDILQTISQTDSFDIAIHQDLESFTEYNLFTWKMNIRRRATIAS